MKKKHLILPVLSTVLLAPAFWTIKLLRMRFSQQLLWQM